jgi:hypothetical protein
VETGRKEGEGEGKKREPNSIRINQNYYAPKGEHLKPILILL